MRKSGFLWNKLGVRLSIQMSLMILVIFTVFYFLVEQQAQIAQKRVFDKAKVFSLILGTHLDRIVSDNFPSIFNYIQPIAGRYAHVSKERHHHRTDYNYP